MKPNWQKRTINGIECAVPADEPARDWFREFKENQPLRGKLSGTRKPRSVKQLRRYWAMCRLVSENTEDPKLATYKLVDWQIRHRLQFYDLNQTVVAPGGHVQFMVLSISFENLKHLEACDYFSRSDQVMCQMLGVAIEEIEEMWRR